MNRRRAPGAVDHHVLVQDLRLSVAAAMPPPDPRHLPAPVARAVRIASGVGAPLEPVLAAVADAEQDRRRAARAVAVASAQTRTVAAGLLLAPALLVPALGRLAGADLTGFYRSRVGLLVLAIGAVLLGCGAALILALVSRVGRPPAAAPPAWVGWATAVGVAVLVHGLLGSVAAVVVLLVLLHRARRPRPSCAHSASMAEATDLLAAALTGGVATSQALRMVAEELEGAEVSFRRLALALDLGLQLGPAAGPEASRLAERQGTPDGPDPQARLVALLRAADHNGAPVAPALRQLARDLRADELARVLADAERLPAQLTFPTTLCLLPATVLLIGAPIVHTGLLAAGP